MNFLFNCSHSILRGNLLQEVEDIRMYPGDVEGMTLDDYRRLEGQLHLELMNACRKYISDLGIISIRGLLDIVKQEVVELEKVTRDSFRKEETDADTAEKIDF